MRIGPYSLSNNLILAPTAGVTDLPFRQLCKALGAGMAVSEMVSSNALLWGSRKTRRRIDHQGETEPRAVQIAGADPRMMADAARYNVDHGAQIIDINMGCPAKKVCNAMAGSALLRDEALVGRILEAVVNAVPVSVTLKIRTGWDPAQRNGIAVAHKHIAWYSKGQTGGSAFRQAINRACTVTEQLRQVTAFLDAVEERVALAA